MDIEQLREYCLDKPGTTEGLPFGENTLVFKVGGKMYLLIGLDKPDSFNVKCDPELAVQLREEHNEVQPGFHMNKSHWNTVYMTGGLTTRQLCEMIDHSYELVMKGLPKTAREAILNN